MKLSKIVITASLIALFNLFPIAPLVQAQTAFDFSVSTGGPQTVVQGYNVYLEFSGKLISGNESNVDVSVQNLPPGSTYTFPDLAKTCCLRSNGSFFSYNTNFDTSIQITTTQATPLGNYTLKFVSTANGITKTINYPLVVKPVPLPLSKVPFPATTPVLAQQKTWEDNMKTYGLQYCNQADILSYGLWDGSVQYYDGERVYYQIADYTGDGSWNTCAQYVEAVYRDTYVIPNNGGIPGYRVFPHGLYQDYLRTNDATSKQAGLMLAHNWGMINSRIDQVSSRETAYALNAMMVGEELGQSNTAEIKVNIDQALGHYDEWFVTKNASYLRPFMAALTAEALMKAYEKTNDPRIPEALQTGAEYMWTNMWDAQAQAFKLTDRVTDTGDTTPAPDLNLLIAPLYGWLYQQTGDVKWRDRGDQIFNGGVLGAWLGSGKHFSENYRLSFDYIKWRQLPTTQTSQNISVTAEGLSGKTITGTAYALNPITKVVLSQTTFTTNLVGAATVSFNLPAQSVALKIVVPKYLTKIVPSVTLGSGTATIPVLFAGDFNADNMVNSIDFSLLNAQWYKSTSSVDINLDGIVNSLDFSYLNKNWNLIGN